MPPAGGLEVVGAAGVIGGTIGATAGVDVGAGATVVVGWTVTVLGATVTVDTDELAAVDVLSSSSPLPAIAAMIRSNTTAPIPPKIHGFFDFFWGCCWVQSG
ncbi:UNVERIFIED_CONTAM: hypothetical protein DES50_10570 [Williamsia faeni]